MRVPVVIALVFASVTGGCEKEMTEGEVMKASLAATEANIKAQAEESLARSRAGLAAMEAELAQMKRDEERRAFNEQALKQMEKRR